MGGIEWLLYRVHSPQSHELVRKQRVKGRAVNAATVCIVDSLFRLAVVLRRGEQQCGDRESV